MAKQQQLIVRDLRLTRWSRFTEALRSITLGPWSTKDKALAGYFGGPATTAGVSVNEMTALSISAVWAAVTMISDDIASLPLHLYRRQNGSKERFEDHPLYRLIHHAPNPEMDSMVWRRTMQAHLLLWSNAYAEVERDVTGRPIAIWPLVPENVDMLRDRFGLRYRHRNPSGGEVFIPADDMIHLVGYSHDGSLGSSLVAHARESLALGMAAERFGGSFYGQGATFGGVITHKGPKPPEQAEKNYRDSVEARHMGVERAHKFLFLWNDAKYEQLGVPPDNAQFIETRNFQVREVARWFKVPPHKLGDLADATFSNVEQQNLDYFTSCLRPWLVLWQQQLSRKLIRPLERQIQFIEHDTHGFLAADAAGRSQLYSAEIRVGSLTPNEIRALENRNPITGGDVAFVSADLVPLNKLDRYWDALIAAKEAKQDDTQPEPSFPTDEQINSLITALEARFKEAQQADREVQQTLVEQAKAELATMVADARAEAAGARNALAKAQEQHETEVALARRGKQEAEDAADRIRGELDDVARRLAEAEQGAKDLALERDEQIAARAAERQEHDTVTAQRDALELDREAEILALRQERDAAKSELDDLTKQRDKLIAERDEQIAGRATDRQAFDVVRAAAASHEVTIGELSQRLDHAVAEALLVRAEANELRSQLEAGQGARAADREASALALAEKDEQIARWQAQWDDRITELAALTTRAEATQAVADELRAQLEAERAQTQATTQRAEAAQAELTKEQVRHAAAATKAQELHEAKIRAYEKAEEHVTRCARAAQGFRPLFVDATERLLQREADRARKAQATPEKLRAWIETFYPLHADVVRSTLRPVVQAWASLAAVDADATLDRLVAEHLTQSTTALRLVAEADDPDQMAASLERTLRRWETERADAVADGLLRENGHA